MARFRALGGTPRAAERVLLCLLTLLGAAWAAHLHHALPWALFPQQYLGAFLGLGLAPVFVGVRASARAPTDRVPIADWVLAASALAVGGYVAVLYPRIAYQLGVLTWDKVVLGALSVGLALEAVRRLTGQALMWIGVACILYVKFAYLLPGLFNAKGASWSRIAAYLYLDTNGILGLPLSVTAGIVVAYVLFGQALYTVGGDRFLTDLALVAMGRYRGGRPRWRWCRRASTGPSPGAPSPTWSWTGR